MTIEQKYQELQKVLNEYPDLNQNQAIGLMMLSAFDDYKLIATFGAAGPLLGKAMERHLNKPMCRKCRMKVQQEEE